MPTRRTAFRNLSTKWFDATAGTWSYAPTVQTGVNISVGQTLWAAGAIDDAGVPWVLYEDVGMGGLYVLDLTQETDWTVTKVADGTSSGVAMAAGESGIYAGMTSLSTGDGMTIMQLGESGWAQLGDAPRWFGSSGLSIVDDGERPVIAFSDRDHGSEISALAYRADTDAWEPLGPPGLSDGAASNAATALPDTALAMAPDGTLYLAYYDAKIGGLTVLTLD